MWHIIAPIWETDKYHLIGIHILHIFRNRRTGIFFPFPAETLHGFIVIFRIRFHRNNFKQFSARS